MTQIHLRLGGNLVFLLTHVVNIIVMHFAVRRPIVEEDKELRTFYSLQFKYITVWNLGFQLMHLGMSIICDLSLVLEMSKGRKSLVEQIRRYKNMFFASILWPTTVLIFTVFWPIFIYDRGLIFPSFIDKVLTVTSNHVMHSFIMVVILWELVFQPRSPPKTHRRNLTYLTVLLLVYLTVILHHYHTAGVWPYPMLIHLYGTIYFPSFVAFIVALLVYSYYIQWPLSTMIHGSKSKVR